MRKLIIIPAYNEEENIEKTVESILRDSTGFDYVVINDCSKDRTKQICEEMMAKYKIDIDKRKFIDKFPVNAFGFTRLKIEIYKGIVGTVNVHVSEKK